MDWQPWITQHVPATLNQRGGATVWPKGAGGLIGDALGPVMHLHDDASEIFYFVSGRCRLEIGNTEEFFGPGDFVLVPPEVPHNLWNAGDDDLLVFWIVAPNLVHNKWRIDNFPPGAMDRRAVRSRIQQSPELPSDANISSRLLTVPGGDGLQRRTSAGQEAIVYVLTGEANVKVGHLAGVLTSHQLVHVPVETSYAVTASDGPASFILFEMPAR